VEVADSTVAVAVAVAAVAAADVDVVVVVDDDVDAVDVDLGVPSCAEGREEPRREGKQLHDVSGCRWVAQYNTIHHIYNIS
jgi:hypothetical protein